MQKELIELLNNIYKSGQLMTQEERQLKDKIIQELLNYQSGKENSYVKYTPAQASP